MASSFTPLSDINKDRMDWKIRVRVCRMWKTTPKAKIQESLEFLFVDEQGSRIHASVKKVHISKYENKVNEGDVCYVHQFSVINSPPSFPITDFRYRIMFHASTIIKTVEMPSFPLSIYNFLDFQNVVDGCMKHNGPVFDIIGRIVDVKEDRMKTDGSVKGSKSLTLLIENLSNVRVQCLLWEPYCFELKNFLDFEREKKNHQVIIIQLCRAKEFTDGIGVSNTFDATKLIMDQNSDVIIEFKSKLNATAVSSSFDGSQISTSSYLSVKGDILNQNSLFHTLRELKEAEVTGKVWVVATISEIRPALGWSYISCPICKKKVVEQEDQFWCNICTKFVIAKERFKVHMTVVDGTSNAPFLLWNETAKFMIGKSVPEVWEIFIQEYGDIEDSDKASATENSKFRIPQPIEDLIGREYLFKVTITEKHLNQSEKVYIVDRFSEDQEMIKSHKKTNHDVAAFTSSPLTDNIEGSNSVQEENDNETIAEFKTPEFPKSGKRNLENALQEEEEHSSTKLPKST